MGLRLSFGNRSAFERTLGLLAKNSFVRTLQGLPPPGKELLETIMTAAIEQKALIGDPRAKDYVAAKEAYELAQLGSRYWLDWNLWMSAMAPSTHSHPTDAEPRTVLDEGGLVVIVAGTSSDTRVLTHSGSPNGVRTQYHSGGY